MITLLKMPALFLGMLAVFCCLGSFFIRENRYESGHLGETVLFGFIAYYFLFELISVPMMVLGAKLHLLAWVWAAVVAVLVIASICLHLGMWREWRKRSGGFWRGKTAAFYVMLVLIGIQLYFVAALQENGSADAAYYVGSVTTNLATDSISSFDPYTGKALDFFNIRYVFSMYPAANAVLCRLTGLHPLVVTKVILCMMTVVLSYLVYAQIGKALLKEKQMVWVLLCFISVVNLNFHTIFSNASFLLTRGYEGKAVLCNIILPFLFYLGLRMYQEKNGKRVWLLFFMTGVAAIDLTMSSMMTVPVAMSAVILPNLVRKNAGDRAGSICLLCCRVCWCLGSISLVCAVSCRFRLCGRKEKMWAE